MLGAIAGDVFGASYEFRSFKEEDFDLFSMPRFFTDDTVLTIATAEVLMGDGDYAGAYRRWGRGYPWCSYGGRFVDWLEDSMGATFTIAPLLPRKEQAWEWAPHFASPHCKVALGAKLRNDSL